MHHRAHPTNEGRFSGRGRGSGSAGPQAQRPLGGRELTQRATVGVNHALA